MCELLNRVRGGISRRRWLLATYIVSQIGSEVPFADRHMTMTFKEKLKITQSNVDIWFGHTNKLDLLVGITRWHVWFFLSWHDIRQRYRRSVLGPFWFTLSTLIMVAVLGLLYSTLFKIDVKSYLPYLGAGLVIWQFISSALVECSTAFVAYSNLIKQIRMPLTTHIVRVVSRNFMILMHSLPVIIIFLVLLGNPPSVGVIFVIPGLLLLVGNIIWIGIVLGVLCARYRDIHPIVANLIQVGFFFTPVMWSPDLLEGRSMDIIYYNPLYYLIENVRAPLLGEPLSISSFLWTALMMLSGFAVAQYLMVKTKYRVIYWL